MRCNLTQAATYNVNGRKPAAGLDLQPWLAGGQGADIVAVGFQEIVPLSAGNVMTGDSGLGSGLASWAATWTVGCWLGLQT